MKNLFVWQKNSLTERGKGRIIFLNSGKERALKWQGNSENGNLKAPVLGAFLYRISVPVLKRKFNIFSGVGGCSGTRFLSITA